MHRIDGDGNVSGEFTQTPTPGNNATEVTADWLNAVQNEIVNFLEANGVTLVKANNTQLTTLMATLFSAAKKIAGDYEVETVVIPGGTDKKIMITNKQTGKYFTITETRSPAGTTVEATHALGAVAAGVDWIFDFSMHNYDAGIMKGVHVLQCFNADTKGAMYWVIRHRPAGQTGYGAMEDYYMMKLDETNGLQVNAAKTEGTAPTWVQVLTKGNLTTELASGWSAALLAALGAGWDAAFAQQRTYFTGDNYLYRYNLNEVLVTTSTTYIASSILWRMFRAGVVKINFRLSRQYGGTAYARIYVNGVAVGTERSTNSSATYSENITIDQGDIVQIYFKNTGGTSDEAWLDLFSATVGNTNL
jgi:hypothetical protein